MSTNTLNVLSAGAAKAVVTAVAQQAGIPLAGAFGAVGAMQDKLLAGEPADVIVLTAPMLQALAAQGRVDGASIAALGKVRTGFAVKAGAARPAIADAEQLRAALLAADALYVPDTRLSTAGKHVAAMLSALGIAGELQARLREYPNGATAMREMAAGKDARPVGCTQVSEILYTPGVDLVGALPAQFELSTVYAAAVCTQAADARAAAGFVATLCGAATAALRTQAGFEL